MPVTWTDHEMRNPRPATAAEVRATQMVLGVRLPSDFIAVAAQHQGRTPNPSIFRLEDGTESIFNNLLHFGGASPSWSITVAWENLPAGIIPFAADPGGSYLCFDYRESADHPPVVFWAHDAPNASTQRVAASFTDLLAILHD
jgi:hypothetical protein